MEVDMDEDVMDDLVVVVVECQKRDGQTDTQTAQLYIDEEYERWWVVLHALTFKQ